MRLSSSLFLFVCLIPLACKGEDSASNPRRNGDTAEPPLDVRNVREVRMALRVKEPDKTSEKYRQYLIHMGEKAFPAYEAILSDPKAYDVEVCGVFGIIYEVKGDCRRFIKYALARFMDSDYGVRRCAVWILGAIGSAAEASPVVALLSDEEKIVAYAAAKTLVAIGGPNEVVAMDVWLRGVSHRDDRELREHVQKCRDALKKRLSEKKDPTK